MNCWKSWFPARRSAIIFTFPFKAVPRVILKAMRRGYTRESYLKIIRKIQNAPRAIAISTDHHCQVFRAKSESDFQDTLSLLDEVQYDSAFSFKYSPRPHTAALDFPGEIPEEEKGRRLDQIQQKQKLIQYNRNAAYLGRQLEVLVEGNARSRFRFMGRLSKQQNRQF